MKEAIARIEGFIMGLNNVEGMFICEDDVDKLLLPLKTLADEAEDWEDEEIE